MTRPRPWELRRRRSDLGHNMEHWSSFLYEVAARLRTLHLYIRTKPCKILEININNGIITLIITMMYWKSNIDKWSSQRPLYSIT